MIRLLIIYFVLLIKYGSWAFQHGIESRSFKDEDVDFKPCEILGMLDRQKESVDHALRVLREDSFLKVEADAIVLPAALRFSNWLREVSVILINGTVSTIGHKCRVKDGFLPTPSSGSDFKIMAKIMKMASPPIMVQALDLTYQGIFSVIIHEFLL